MSDKGKITRRDFLKAGGILVASASLMGGISPEKLFASSDIIMENSGEKEIEKLLSIAMKKGGDFGEIYFENSRSTSIKLQESKIQSNQIGYSRGAGIRVLEGDKCGYAYSDDLSMGSLEEAAEVASNIACDGGTDKIYPVNEKEVPNYYSIDIHPHTVDIGKKLDIIKRANEAGYAFDKRVKSVRIGYEESVREIKIGNTEGIMVEDKQNSILFWVSVVLQDGDKKQSCFYGDGGHVGFEFFEKVSPESIVEVAVKRALVNLDAREAPAGPMEVVLNGQYGAILLHEAIGHGLEADFNRKKLSAYSDLLGKKIASQDVNIYDDATLDPKQRGTINIDDESAFGRKTVLVEKGVLKNYMQDRLNAKAMNMEITGNGRRQSFKYAPVPRMTNTVMGNGKYSSDEVISSVKHGFYAKAMTNGQVNISSGDFMFFVDEGYMIENGKITCPVRGATLIGNGPDVLSKINMVGNDFTFAPCYFTCGKNGQSVPVGFGMPTVKISELTVGGTNVK